MAQDDILSTKGCKRDPYTETEYNSHHAYYSEWLVGWVRNSSTDAIQYYNSQGTVQKTISKGQPANPYSEDEYLYKLVQEGNWPGGWVINSNAAIRYIDISNQSGNLIALGKQQNPYYYVEFNNMYVNNNWHGGWVEYENETKAYINAQGEEDEAPEASGSGCGSGSGSGSGSGDGGESCEVTPGTEYIGIVTDKHYRVEISWTAGTACPGGSSSISGRVVGSYTSSGNLQPESQTLNCFWTGPYTASIGGAASFAIPGFYHCT